MKYKQLVNSNVSKEWPNVEIQFNRPVELYMDHFHDYKHNSPAYKILYVREAEAILPSEEKAIRNAHLFDAILTFNENIIRACPNAHFFPFGTTWVWDYPFPQKHFSISHVLGGKNMTTGHKLRSKVYYNQSKIKNPIDFYISHHGGVINLFNSKILEESKAPLFDSQFHICIENSQMNNYFTEKVIDCFATKTIPIYWGAPNISDFFNASGMFITNSLEEIIDTCNNITPQTYNDMISVVEHNYEESKKYWNLAQNIQKSIQTILDAK